MNKKSQGNRCSRCGRVLRDPVSLAIGMGPECRGEGKVASRRQAYRSNQILRGQAYTDRAPIKFINFSYFFDPASGKWANSNNGHLSTDESLRSWMKKNELAIFPDEYIDSLVYRRDLIVSTLNSESLKMVLTQENRDELTTELYLIQDALDLEEAPETKPAQSVE